MPSASSIETMAQIIHAVLLFLILNTGATESKKSSDQTAKTSLEKQLHRDLKGDYDFLATPKSNQSAPFTVHVRFMLKSFEFISHEEVLSLYTWMFISWIDDRLKWDPEKYGGLKKTDMTSLDIWMPMFRLYNSADENDYERFFYVRCNVNYKGSVLCVPRTTHETVCRVKLANWPYDRQKCSVIYGSYDQQGIVKMSFGDRSISMIGAEYGAKWTIVDYEQIEDQNSEKQLEMIFTLEREAVTLAALIICPSFILIALTVGSLLLDVRCNIRLYLICFSLFCHYYFVSELGRNIPKESIDSPTIILYYRGLEILTVLVFLLTMALRVLCKKISPPFKMITNINYVVYNGFGTYLVYPKWESEDGNLERLGEDYKKDWTKFANLLNSLCAIVFIIVYVCLYCVFMPQPYPMIN